MGDISWQKVIITRLKSYEHETKILSPEKALLHCCQWSSNTPFHQ